MSTSKDALQEIKNDFRVLYHDKMKAQKKINIFCVDDDAVFLSILENEIKKTELFEIKVDSFINGLSCLKHIDAGPQIVILDYYLDENKENEINGIDILKKIKKISPDSYVVMLSAQDKIEVAVNSMKHGAFDYIVKNESSFARIQNVIKNIAFNINLKKEIQAYKYGSIAAASFIISIVISIVILNILFPRLF